MSDRNELARTALAAKTLADAIAAAGAGSKEELLQVMTAAGDERVRVRGGDGEDFGTFTWTPGKQSATVTDAAKFLTWVKERYPTEITSMVNPAFQARILAHAAKAGDPVDEGGELIPGVTVRQGDPYLTCRASALAKTRAATLVAGDGLPALLAGPAEAHVVDGETVHDSTPYIVEVEPTP
jgi:hypothetical protein